MIHLFLQWISNTLTPGTFGYLQLCSLDLTCYDRSWTPLQNARSVHSKGGKLCLPPHPQELALVDRSFKQFLGPWWEMWLLWGAESLPCWYGPAALTTNITHSCGWCQLSTVHKVMGRFPLFSCSFQSRHLAAKFMLAEILIILKGSTKI